MNTLRLLMICTVSYGFLLFGGDKPARGEPISDTVVRKRVAGQQAKNLQVSQITATGQKLQQRIDVAFFNTPLKEVVASLSTQLDVPFYLDKRALTEVGLDSNTPVNIDLRNIKAEVALILIMKSLQLTWVVQNEMVHVTTPEAAEDGLQVRVYPCRDFLKIPSLFYDRSGYGGGMGGGGMGMGGGGMGMGGGGMGMGGGGMGGFQNVPPGRIRGQMGLGGGGDSRHRVKTLDELINLIKYTIGQLSWDDQGGTGTAEFLSGGILIISATSRVHAEVEQLLQKLRTAK
jgi:hypothetical protein